MSENLDLVHSILAEWERGDFRSVDWAHRQIEYAIVDEPGSRVGWGVAAMTHTWRDFLTAWDDYRVEAHEYRELDGERVLVALRAQGRGKASGLDIGASGGGRGSANVFHVRAGKVTRLVTYFDRDRALTDVGLAGSPTTTTPEDTAPSATNRP
jgi:ketosteroid isomerase-like protein